MWLNASFVGIKTKGVIIHGYCPFDYCQPREMNIKLENPDFQCDFNRVNILCGGCQKGLSSSQCLPCSNTYLTPLIAFCNGWFHTCFFLTFQNLTVSQGLPMDSFSMEIELRPMKQYSSHLEIQTS